MVIVTTAVYGLLERLNPPFKLPHWAERRGHEHPFEVSPPYVFEKQSSTTDILGSRFVVINDHDGPKHALSRSYCINLPSSLR